MEEHRQNKRKRSVLACDACRARRTKCDSQKPSCRYCRTHELDCVYQEAPAEPPSRIEEELDAVKQRLDHIISLIQPPPGACMSACIADQQNIPDAIVVENNSPFDLSSKLLGNSSTLHVLGLDADFSQALIRRERANGGEFQGIVGPRMLIVSQAQAIVALAAFSARVHIWYPIFPSDFTQEYFRVLSGNLSPSSSSCLVLLVTSIGNLAQDGGQCSDDPYFETALASLPIILSECSVRSVQCFMLISLYYCCSMRPCLAQEYCLIASSKIQNIVTSELEGSDVDTIELTRRTYWGALLLENEITCQFDVAKSSIWRLDEHVPLPACHHVWKYIPDDALPGAKSDISNGTMSIGLDKGDSGSFFLAEIAMRRMLHRCNTAVKATRSGKYVYAPAIALELERQLEEWYSYLPEMNRFERGDASVPLEQTNFLRVQYYCCKLSIYWPAIFQVIQDGKATPLLLEHCQIFFDSYLQVTPSILAAFHNCVAHRWTLFITIFTNTVAVMSAAHTACLEEFFSDQLYQCLSVSGHADQTILQRSPSLMMLQGVLEERLMKAGLW